MSSTHKVLLDPVQYTSKPSSPEAAIITTRIIKHPVKVSVENLAPSICAGQTWTPAYFEGNRDNDSWLSQSILALDFDCGLPPEVLLKRLKDQGLDCTFAYASFSSTPEVPKYRLVWQLEQMITDAAKWKQMMEALKTILPEHDKKAVSLAQMFYGGKKLIYENYNYCLDLPQLLIEFGIVSAANSKPQTLSRDLKRLSKKLGDVSWMKNGNAYNNKYKEFQISSKSASKKTLLKVDWEALREEIRILNDLVSGKWLDYPQYFGLASNLIHLNGGVSLYKKSLDKMVELNQNDPAFLEALQETPSFVNKLHNLPAVIKFYDYQPTRLENFSVYEEDWIYSNLLHAGKKSQVVRVKPYATIPLVEAEQKFENTFNSVLLSEDSNVHVFKVSTGLGKTRRLEALDNVLVAVPNHDLKHEIAQRMKVSVKVTPNLPSDLPPNVKKTIDCYFSIGAIEEANRFITQEAQINQDLADYLKQLRSAYVSGETVLTTHQKALFIDFSNLDTIIFDEDPISSLFSTGSIPISDLINLRGRLDDKADKKMIDDHINSLMYSQKNSPLQMTEIDLKSLQAIEDEVLVNSYKYKGNVLAFFNSNWCFADPHEPSTIHFIKQNPLPVDKKVIILSATADEQIYRTLFGDRLRFYDISNVEVMGVIEHDSTFSLSRSSLKNENHLAYAKQQVGHLPILTFRNYKHLFANSVELMHYGKLSGFDALAGKDIAIVGTPHKNPVVYLLFAAALGIEFRPQDVKMQVQVIERNGMRFPLQTYAHEGLRTIHLFFLESEQEQAIGRARPIRHSVSIKLLSSVPHPQACINEDEKQLGQKKLEAMRKME